MKPPALSSCIAFALCAAWGLGASASDPIPWKAIPMSTTVNEQEVADFIKDFTSSQDISVSVSEAVGGTVNASFENKLPSEIFNSVAKAYGLVPFYDGSILYIYAASEMKSSVVALEKLETKEFKDLLEQLSVFDDGFTFRELPEQGIVYVSGPPRYVELLEELATKFESRSVEKEAAAKVQQTSSASEIVVRYFPLRYAHADDVQVDLQDREVTIPGVARLLGHVLGQSAPELREAPTGKTSRQKPRTVERLKGQGLVEGETPVRINQESLAERTEAEVRTEEAEAIQEEKEQQPSGAFVQADSRLNAVIVADRAEKMPLYEKLIEDLDKPAGVIEINAAIIDMNANANVTFGVNYRGQDFETIERTPTGAAGTTGLFRAGQNADTSLVDGASLVAGGGLNTSALIVGTTFQILARIQAMEEAGEAQVLSRPSVITVDNTEATLRDDQTIYIRVAGQEEVDLFPVSAGVMLRVTPHLIPSNGKDEPDKIRLQVRIEDGDFSSENVDAIPIVRRSEITTQAVVAQNESLLIGGQYRHEQSNGETRVPLAGRVPILGNAFKNKRVINNKRQRLFLISPNVINPDQYYRKAEQITRETIGGPPITDLELPEKEFPAERDFENPVTGEHDTHPDTTGTDPNPSIRARPVQPEEEKPNFLQRLFLPR